MKTPEEIKDGLGLCSKAQHGNVCGKCPYQYGNVECIVSMVKDALAYIQQLEDHIGDLTKMVPRWISVKEREPEPFISVLGYIPNNDPFPPVRECFRVCVGDADSYYFPVLADYKGITHWMEIPEPPKEDT